MGGEDRRLLGTALISAANMGLLGNLPRAEAVKRATQSTETLADTSPEQMADELIAGRADNDFRIAARGLAAKPLLVLASEDGLAQHTDALVAAVRAAGGTRIDAQHVKTDHDWSDRRIDLQARVIRWLRTLALVER